jgi:hypothetical protein
VSAVLGWEAAIGFVQMVVLAGLYGFRSRWRASLMGWVLMGSFLIKAIIFGMILAGRLFGPLGLFWWAVAMAVFDLVQFGWIILLLRQQREERAERDRAADL